MSAFRTIDHWVSDHGDRTPEKIALRFAGKEWTYRTFARQIGATANYLASGLGLDRGDRVAWYGLNHAEIMVLYFACARLGLIFMPLNWRLAVPELRFIMADAEPSVVFFDHHFSSKVSGIITHPKQCPAIAVGGDDGLSGLRESVDIGAVVSDDISTDQPLPFLLVYTSGTTGRPKGALLSQQAMISNARMSQHMYGMTADDHVLNFLPLFHVGGLNIHVSPAFFAGASVTFHDRFDPEVALETIRDAGISIVNSVPTILKAMLNSPLWSKKSLATMRTFSIGSTDVPLELIEAVHHTGVPVIQIYGATETSPIAIYQRISEARKSVGSIGSCGIDCKIRLVGADGRDVPRGENGEIWVSGANILMRYWNNEKATKAALVDGWFRSGDVARQDENGNYWFADRLKHVIISGGENIYSAELQRVLNGIAGLAESAVVGMPDEKWGEIPVVVAVRNNPAISENDILSVFDGALARYKHPKRVHFVDALPRNAMGKVVMDDVRKLLAA